MNTKQLFAWEIIGGIFLILAGSFIHFVYSDIWKSFCLLGRRHQDRKDRMGERLNVLPVLLFLFDTQY